MRATAAPLLPPRPQRALRDQIQHDLARAGRNTPGRRPAMRGLELASHRRGSIEAIECADQAHDLAGDMREALAQLASVPLRHSRAYVVDLAVRLERDDPPGQQPRGRDLGGERRDALAHNRVAALAA